MIVNHSNLAILNQAFSAAFQSGIEQTAPMWSQLASMVPSTTSSTGYGWLGKMTQFREWVGERHYQRLKAHDYTIKNKTFENTVTVGREEIEDDQYGVYKLPMQQLGQDAAVHPDELVFDLFNAGFTTACYDGQYFFDTDHPVYANVDGTGAVTTVSNATAGTGPAWYLLDCSRAIKPVIFQQRIAPQFTEMTDDKDETVFMKDEYRYGVRARGNVGFGFWQMAHQSKAELTPENFNAAYTAMTSQKADGGRPLGIRPTLLVVPPSLRQQALNITKAELIGNGVTNTNAGLVDTLVTPWVL